MAFSWWQGRSSKTSLSEIDPEAGLEKQIDQLREKAPIPNLWLFGKTGSGKSSVVRFLTGAQDAVIGEGFRPETKTSRRFDFPDAVEPLLSFLDTRGLGEADYDPSEDIQRFSHSSQLMIVTVRVTDHALEGVIKPLRTIRNSSPDRPVILLLTCLHQATGTLDITDGDEPFEGLASSERFAEAPIPDPLRTLLIEKLKQFDGLFDTAIPVDLTQLEDGFANPDFGGDRLKQSILEQLPQAYRQALLALRDLGSESTSIRQKKSRWQVLASSALAGTAGAVPVPWVDIPAVLGIQAHLAVKIAKIYDQEITPARWAVLSSAAGTHIALRMAVREAIKFVPFVGVAVGAASSFAFTYALGMSWDWYFADLRKGNVPTPAQLKEIFAEELRRGHELWKAK